MSMALSPVEAFGRPRTRLRWLDAATILEQFALVTFDVDPERLRTVLPAVLDPEVRTLDDGRTRGFVSAVSFRDVDFRFAVAPWLRVSFFQTNYRAYVRGPGRAAGGPLLRHHAGLTAGGDAKPAVGYAVAPRADVDHVLVV
jgi:hypothetical protein